MLFIADKILHPAVPKFGVHVLLQRFNQLRDEGVNRNGGAVFRVSVGSAGMDVEFLLEKSEPRLHVITEILTQN
jgi:hypothetical protein